MDNEELTTRERMVQATCELLETQGYHATGLNEILQRSSAPRGSLYYYFPQGKEELAIEAIERQGHIVERRMRITLAEYEDAAEAVTHLLQSMAYLASQEGCQILGPITAVAVESAYTNQRLREICANIYERWRLVVEKKLVECHYEPNEATKLSMMILSAIEGATVLTRALHSPDPLLQTGELLGTLLRKQTP